MTEPTLQSGKLEPCPFCGEEMTLTSGRSAAIDAREFYNPSCERCNYVFQDGYYNIEDAIKAANSRAPVVAPEGDEDPSVGKFLVAISDGLRHAIRDHGPITKERIGSAAKRVWSRIRNTRYDPFRALTAPSPSSPVPDTCVKCGHGRSLTDNEGRCSLGRDYHGNAKDWCGCKCEFPAATLAPVTHPFGPCGYKYCDWPDGELRCNEPRHVVGVISPMTLTDIRVRVAALSKGYSTYSGKRGAIRDVLAILDSQTLQAKTDRT